MLAVMTVTVLSKYGVSMEQLEVHSLAITGHLIHDVVNNKKMNFLCLTEMWQQPDDRAELNLSPPHGFVYSCQAPDVRVVS